MKTMTNLKVILLLIAISIVSMSICAKDVNGEDVYKVGTKFKYQKGGGGGCLDAVDEEDQLDYDANDPNNIIEYAFTGEKNINGKDYLILSNTKNTDPFGPIGERCYMRFENNKVYKRPLNPKYENPAWDYPIYDFDIQPGEVIKVCTQNCFGDKVPKSDDVMFVKCLDRTKVVRDGEEYDGITVLYIYKDGLTLDIEDVIDEYSKSNYEMEPWVAGVGGEIELLHMPNMRIADCGGYSLLQVERNGDCYYNCGVLPLPSNGIESVNTEVEENSNRVRYNLNGIPCGDDEKGIVISNGKKYILR